MNADPEVRKTLGPLQTRAEADAAMDRFEAEWERCGYGLFALERRDTEEFIGFTGLHGADFPVPFLDEVEIEWPAVEIGWRLARSAWGNGFATEAAQRSLAFGFNERELNEIVSFTAVTNGASRRVMERIGLEHDPRCDFDHPNVPAESPLLAHVLYRLNRSEWISAPRH